MLEDLAELNAITFDMPQELKKIVWMIPADEIDIPDPTPVAPTPVLVAPAAVSTLSSSSAVAPVAAAASGAAAAKSQSAIGKKTGGAIVTALAIAITTYIGRRIYQKKKERLMRKYKLASLTPLQNNVWRAVALAHIRMPWYLQYLIKNNTGTLAGFIGSDPRAAAELYYGRVPNEAEVKAFQSRFFRNVQ